MVLNLGSIESLGFGESVSGVKTYPQFMTTLKKGSVNVHRKLKKGSVNVHLKLVGLVP